MINTTQNQTMTNREWLNRGFKLAIEIREIKTALEMAKSEAEYISPNFNEKVDSGQANHLEARYINRVTLWERLSKLIEDKQDILCQIETAIEKIDDVKIRTVLWARYVNCKTVEVITEEQGYDYRWTRRLIKKGIEGITRG